MSPIRRELLNGLLVLVIASLLSVAFSAFQVTFNAQLWVLILTGIAIATGFYIVFELTLGFMAASGEREKDWLERVGTPARLAPVSGFAEMIKAISPGSDYTVLYYYGPEGGGEWQNRTEAQRQSQLGVLDTHLGRVKQGKIREYKRIICFDHEVLANNPDLRSGILRVGEGPGTIDRRMGEHCRLMMKTKGCSLYVAPAILRSTIGLLGVESVGVLLEAAEPDTGGRQNPAAIFFTNPPNAEIVEQFRQMERETERRMVAVREVRLPEDAEPKAEAATR